MTTLELNKFNETGIETFFKFIEDSKKNEEATRGIKLPYKDLHLQPNLIVLIDKSIKIDPNLIFTDRYEMAHYLKKQIGEYCEDLNNYGMWAWLCGVYFNQLRGKLTNRVEHYIPFEHKLVKSRYGHYSNLYYRHSVRMPVHLVNNYEEDWCKFILKNRMSSMGDPMENTCSNQINLKSKKLREVIIKLYMDKKSFSPKTGAFSEVNNSKLNSLAGKGGVRRFNLTLRDRLKKSYDIENMDVKTVISKLGREINTSKWVK